MFDQETMNQFEKDKVRVLKIIEELKEFVETAECVKGGKQYRSNPNRLPPGRMIWFESILGGNLDYYRGRMWEAECDAVDERNKKIVEAMKKYEHNLTEMQKEAN